MLQKHDWDARRRELIANDERKARIHIRNLRRQAIAEAAADAAAGASVNERVNELLRGERHGR
ncbi:MAG: hypothetical protein ABSA68_02600 [Xanthobacteraceae bacterium]|jgi:hypothetical protein